MASIYLILISAYCLCLSVADFGLNTLDFDISLLYLVSNAETDDYELVLCSCMISMFIYHYSSTLFNEIFLYMHLAIIYFEKYHSEMAQTKKTIVAKKSNLLFGFVKIL